VLEKPRTAAVLVVYFCMAVAPVRAGEVRSFETAQAFLKTYCLACHQDRNPQGGFSVKQVSAKETLAQDARRWTALIVRVKNGEMPPKGAPAPLDDQRRQFVDWAENAVRAEVCAAGVQPGPSPIRRLNRDEYTATIRDLLDIHLDIGRMLPADGAGGEGFDNAAETLFLSPLHSEKYIEAAKLAMDFAAKEYKSRMKLLVAKPGPGVSEQQAAYKILREFLPRAFRRPVAESEIVPYRELYRAARSQGEPFEPAVFFALRSALVSPLFLFRIEPPNHSPAPRPVDQYALASRLSYFLWGSMPDELLFDIAAEGKLHEPEVLRQLIPRMLRNDRSLAFAQRFIEQWLHTRQLDTDKAPDPDLFPAYANDEELRSDIRLQPVLFFRELLIRDLSLLNLLDSKFTIGTSNLEKHFDEKLPLSPGARKQPQWVELPEGSRRGGLLGMPAVLAVSSYPYRTSPVLRGTWILESLLGTPPPPPPPDVPALEEPSSGAAPKSMRERLMQHRANPACASCHDRIDPLGFALENYDVIGRWREEDGGFPIDNTGELPDGRKIQGPERLKAYLMEQRDVFIRNLAGKMLGYALGRGLTVQDSCTVDSIVAELKANDYRAQKLIEAIVLSVPFRYQAARAPQADGQERRLVSLNRKE
jgi:cytochrome c551/c552